MPLNNRIGSRPASYMRTENNGMYQNSGPFIGIIKNNIDPTRAGRLEVFIPHMGAPDSAENDQHYWVRVSYASPFRGQTRQRADLDWYIDSSVDFTTTDGAIQENSFQSYGFWFVPPDLNGRVLVFFANGDPNQGYWTSCIADSMDSHMVPGIGAVSAATSNNPGGGGYIWQPKDNANNDPEIPSHTLLEKYIQISGNGNKEIPLRLPVSEPVIVNQANSNPTTPQAVLMVPQVYQTRQLGIQGLAFDFLRGTTSASSVREYPSQVFGISTPGRQTSFADVSLSNDIFAKLSSATSGDVDPNSSDIADLRKALGCSYRTGGHQFVMDDGTVNCLDQGIRIRTTNGNQLLLDDTNGQIYFINSTGNAWVELSPSGFIDIFGNMDFSVRTHGNINLHADKNIIFNAGQKIQMHADQGMQLDVTGSLAARSTGGLTLYDTTGMNFGTSGALQVSNKQTSFNSGSSFTVQATNIQMPGQASAVKDPGSLNLNKQIEVGQQSGSQAWWQTGTFKTLVSRAPAHEPWPNHEINGIRTSLVPQGNAFGTAIARTQTNTTSSGVRGTQKGSSINEAHIPLTPVTGDIQCLSGKVILNNAQTQALLAQIGHRESSGNYTLPPTPNHSACGKYQFEPSSLQDGGYVYNPMHAAGGIQNSANWTGLNNITSLQAWLGNGAEQEKAMMVYTQQHFNQLQKFGVLSCSSTAEDAGGYLMAAHLVGIGGAILLFNKRTNSDIPGAVTADANGTTSTSYFALGSSAVQLGSSSTNAPGSNAG